MEAMVKQEKQTGKPEQRIHMKFQKSGLNIIFERTNRSRWGCRESAEPGETNLNSATQHGATISRKGEQNVSKIEQSLLKQCLVQQNSQRKPRARINNEESAAIIRTN